MSDPRLEAIRRRLDMPTGHSYAYYTYDTLRQDVADLLALIDTLQRENEGWRRELRLAIDSSHHQLNGVCEQRDAADAQVSRLTEALRPISTEMWMCDKYDPPGVKTIHKWAETIDKALASPDQEPQP